MAQEQLAKLQADLKAIQAQQVGQQAQADARQMVLGELRLSVTRIQEASKKTPANPAGPVAAQLAATYITHVEKEAREHAQAAAATAAKVAPAQKMITDLQAQVASRTQAAAALPKRVEALQAAIKAINMRLPAETAANQEAQNLLKHANDSLARAKSFQVSATVPPSNP